MLEAHFPFCYGGLVITRQMSIKKATGWQRAATSQKAIDIVWERHKSATQLWWAAAWQQAVVHKCSEQLRNNKQLSIRDVVAGHSLLELAGRKQLLLMALAASIRIRLFTPSLFLRDLRQMISPAIFDSSIVVPGIEKNSETVIVRASLVQRH